jgi:hypothetical protein
MHPDLTIAVAQDRHVRRAAKGERLRLLVPVEGRPQLEIVPPRAVRLRLVGGTG